MTFNDISRHYGWGTVLSPTLDQLHLPQELGAKVDREPIVAINPTAAPHAAIERAFAAPGTKGRDADKANVWQPAYNVRFSFNRGPKHCDTGPNRSQDREDS